MEAMTFQRTAPTASPVTCDSSCEESASSIRSKNMMLSRKDWEDLKPIIRELYLHQGQTLKELAKYLEEHHRFKPTKKQLTYHISCWGFEKNVKKEERRAIIEHFGTEIERLDVASQAHRGRKLDKAKLNRWMRLENRSSNGFLVTNDQLADNSAISIELETSTLDQAPHHDQHIKNSPQSEESELVSFCSMDDKLYWNSVDVIGSPRLTKLIGALTIEECDMPALDLDVDVLDVEDILTEDLLDLCEKDNSAEENTSPSYMFEKRARHFWQYELYPFPTPRLAGHGAEAFYSSISIRPEISDLECRRRLRNLNHLTNAEVINLVHIMDTEAKRLLCLGFWSTAETWLRRVVTAKQKVKWYKPEQTLRACVNVIECMVRQDRQKEAQPLHKDFHVKLERLLGADHCICLKSKTVLAVILRKLDFRAEAESIRRQVLQSLLTTLGPRHPYTIDALHNLAHYLELLGKHREQVQHLFEVVVRFLLEPVKTAGDTRTKDLDTIQTIALLADAFNSDGRYRESEDLWNYAHRMLGNSTRTACSQTFSFYCKKARGYRLQKRFGESRKILRGLLRHHEESMCDDMKIMVIRELTQVLMETSFLCEAEIWLRKLYFLNLKVYGPADRDTMSCCASIGNCLSGQGQYYTARLFFKNVLKTLDFDDDGETEPRLHSIQVVNHWILITEEMVAMQDPMEICSGSDEDEGEWLDTDHDDENDRDIGGSFDPLRDS